MKRYAPWAIFIGCLLLLGLGATPIGKAADLALISVRLSVVALLSVLAVWESWNYFRDDSARHDTLLDRCRRWYPGQS